MRALAVALRNDDADRPSAREQRHAEPVDRWHPHQCDFAALQKVLEHLVVHELRHAGAQDVFGQPAPSPARGGRLVGLVHEIGKRHHLRLGVEERDVEVARIHEAGNGVVDRAQELAEVRRLAGGLGDLQHRGFQLLRLRALRDVAHHRGEEDVGADVPAGDRQFQRDLRPASSYARHLERHAGKPGFTTPGHPREPAQVVLAESLGHQIRDRLPDGFRGRVAEDPLGGRVPEDDPPVPVGGHDRVAGGLQHSAQALLGGPQRPVGVLALAVLAREREQVGAQQSGEQQTGRQDGAPVPGDVRRPTSLLGRLNDREHRKRDRDPEAHDQQRGEPATGRPDPEADQRQQREAREDERHRGRQRQRDRRAAVHHGRLQPVAEDEDQPAGEHERRERGRNIHREPPPRDAAGPASQGAGGDEEERGRHRGHPPEGERLRRPERHAQRPLEAEVHAAHRLQQDVRRQHDDNRDRAEHERGRPPALGPARERDHGGGECEEAHRGAGRDRHVLRADPGDHWDVEPPPDDRCSGDRRDRPRIELRPPTLAAGRPGLSSHRRPRRAPPAPRAPASPCQTVFARNGPAPRRSAP